MASNQFLHDYIKMRKGLVNSMPPPTQLNRIEPPRKEEGLKLVNEDKEKKTRKKKSESIKYDSDDDKILKEIIETKPPKKYIMAYLQKKINREI